MEIGDHVVLNTFRRRVEYESVSPDFAGQRVVADTACELISAGAANQMIVALIAEQRTIAVDSDGFTTADLTSDDVIIASTTVKFVVPDAADDLIVAIIAKHAIIAVTCAGVIPEQNVITITTVDIVVAGAGDDCVVPVSGIYKVVAVPSEDGVVSVSPDDRIRASVPAMISSGLRWISSTPECSVLMVVDLSVFYLCASFSLCVSTQVTLTVFQRS